MNEQDQAEATFLVICKSLTCLTASVFIGLGLVISAVNVYSVQQV